MRIGATRYMGGIPSVPESGGFSITNLYVDSIGKLQIDYENTPGSSAMIETQPPEGSYAVANLYVMNGKLVVKYNN